MSEAAPSPAEILEETRELDPLVRPYVPGNLVRFGTSSFSSKDWVGPFYPRGMAPGEFLTHYARAFDCVEIDATYYAIPAARTVDGWADKTPSDFRICLKFPRSIVHAGKGAKPDARSVVAWDAVGRDVEAFLSVARRLGERLDTLLIQFPYFNRQAFPSAGPFLERLDDFLGRLPREGFRYAVEIRNKAWLKEPYQQLLAKHEVSFVLVDQGWMPHGDEVMAKHDVFTAEPLYIRLLGDRQRIEKITKTWEKEVLDHEASLDRWAGLLAQAMEQGRRSLVFVNNHYAGHAPSTVRRLREHFLEAAGG